MKKLFGLLLVLFVVGGAQGAFANNYCDPCYDPCCDFHVSVYGDYLYWKGCRTDLDYSLDDDNTYYVNPGYDSGWRVGGRLQRCNWDLGARYTSYDSKTKVHETTPRVSTDTDFTYSVDYDVADIELGYSIQLCCDQALIRPFLGAKLAWIDEAYIYSTSDRTETDDKRFEGYGLYAGLEGEFQIYQLNMCQQCIPMSLIGRGSLAALDSHQKEISTEDGGEFNSQRIREEQCIIVPVLEVFAGLNFGGVQCGCVTPSVLIGYEAQLWGNRRFDDNDEIAFLGFSGLVARLSLDY